MTGARTIHFEFRAPSTGPDAGQFVFRAEIDADSERDAFDQGAAYGRLVWKLAEGFGFGQLTIADEMPQTGIAAPAPGVTP